MHPTCRVRLGFKKGKLTSSANARMETAHLCFICVALNFSRAYKLEEPTKRCCRGTPTAYWSLPAYRYMQTTDTPEGRPARDGCHCNTPAHRNPGAIHYPLLSCLARIAHSLSDPKHTGFRLQPTGCLARRLLQAEGLPLYPLRPVAALSLHKRARQGKAST